MARTRTAPLFFAGVLALTASPATAPGAPEPGAKPGAGPSAPPADPRATGERLVEAKPPPFSEGIFPCMDCHADAKDPTRRELGFHDEQQSIFDHDAEHRWCLDCHDYENRNVLRLANGAPVPFTESYRLCGQCHGDKLRDWRLGIHGRRVGMWNGAKEYLLCASCHNPHSPAFKGVKEIMVEGRPTVAPALEPLKPEPRPHRPEEMRR